MGYVEVTPDTKKGSTWRVFFSFASRKCAVKLRKLGAGLEHVVAEISRWKA